MKTYHEIYYHYTVFLMDDGSAVCMAGPASPDFNQLEVTAIHHVNFGGDWVHIVVADEQWTCSDWSLAAKDFWSHLSPYSHNNTTPFVILPSEGPDDEQPSKQTGFRW